MAMKMTATYGIKVMWRGEDVAVFDAEKCSGCNRCAKVCPFGAIATDGRNPVIPHAEKCWGCGICRSACSQDAIRLVDRRSIASVTAVW